MVVYVERPRDITTLVRVLEREINGQIILTTGGSILPGIFKWASWKVGNRWIWWWNFPREGWIDEFDDEEIANVEYENVPKSSITNWEKYLNWVVYLLVRLLYFDKEFILWNFMVDSKAKYSKFETLWIL